MNKKCLRNSKRNNIRTLQENNRIKIKSNDILLKIYSVEMCLSTVIEVGD